MASSERTLRSRKFAAATVAVLLITGIFTGNNDARGQALQAKWSAAAQQSPGHDPVQWWLSRERNAEKRHPQLFLGVDLTYIYDDTGLNAVLTLSPRTNLKTIQFQFDDRQAFAIDGNGGAALLTALGSFQLSAPELYQTINGLDIPISGGYQESANGTLGFWSANYDRQQPLQIRFRLEVVKQQTVAPLPGAPQTVTITSTKTDALFTDNNANTKADPGDTLQYTVTVSNSGDENATGVVFNDTIDVNTTLVPGSVDTTPIAVPDTYNAVGNIRIQVPDTSGLITNDIEADGTGGLTITAQSITSANGGDVTIAADGSFVYNPPPGFEGGDTFNYTLNDGEGNSDTGTATITVAGMIWFIDNTGAPPSDGRLTNPFTSIAQFNTTAADAAGDNIFIHESPNPYAGPITLLNNQRLIGAGASSTLTAITGITPPSFSDAFPATGGTAPTINTNGVTLGQNNTIRGFVITATGVNAKITGNGFGTLTLGNSTTPDVTISGSGMALNLTTGTFAATSGLASLATTSSGTQGIFLSAVGGTIAFGSTTISGSTTQGILVTGSTVSVNFGNTSVTGGTDAISLQNNSAGARTFGTIATTNNSGIGFLHAVGGGTTTAGATTITNPGTQGISIQNSTTSVTFGNTNVTGSGGTGVFMNANSGAVTFADLDIAPDANQRPFHATNNTGTITTTSGTMSGGAAIAVEIVGTSSANRTPLNMTLTSVSSDGASSGMILTNTSANTAGFVITGNSSGVCGGNVTNNGAIVTVANAADCTGGAITNSTGPGILLTTVSNISFTRIRVANSGEDGIRGNVVSSLSFTASLIENNGNAVGERGVEIANLSGSGGFTNVTVRGSSDHNVNILNSNGAGNLTAFNVSASQFAAPNFTTGDDGFLFENNGDGSMALNITQCAFTDNKGDHFQFATQAGVPITNSTNFIFSNNTLLTTTTNDPNVIGGGITISPSGSADLTFIVSNNNIQQAFDDGINLNVGTASTTNSAINGTISNNTIGSTGQQDSGSESSNTITVTSNGAATTTVAVTNNTVRQYSNFAGIMIVNKEGSSTLNATVTGNSVTEPGTFALNGIRVDAGATSGPPADDGLLCAVVTGNSVTTSGLPDDIRMRQRFSTTIRLPGYAGAPTDTTAVNAFVSGNNPGGPAVTSVVNSPPGGGFVGGAACPLPSLPPITSPEPQGKQQEQSGNLSKRASDLSGTVFAKGSNQSITVNPAVSAVRFDSQSTDERLIAQSNAINLPASPNSLSTPVSGETINLNIGILPPGKSITVRFRATIDSPFPQGVGQVCNQATISGGNFGNVLSDDPDVGGATDPTCTTLAQANLSITKTDSPDPVPVGSNITYTLTFANNGPDGATNVVVSDAVPADTTFVSAAVTSGTGWTPSTPPVGGTGTVTFSKAAVAAAEGATFEIVVQTNGGLPDGTIISNTATTTSETPDGDINNNSDTETTLVQAPADIAVTKTDTPDPVIAGNNITYAINFVNNGPNASNDVSVTDDVPAGTTFVSATVTSGTGWTPTTPPVGGTGTVEFTKALVATSETASFEIVVNVTSTTADATVISNTVNANATTLDDVPGNNTDTETTTVQSRADLAVTKSDSPDPVVAGTNLTYTINFVNNGPSAASTVSVGDPLPAGTTFVSATAPAGWTSTTPPVGGTGTVTFTKATVAPAEAAAFTIVVNVNASVANGSVITNSATATSTTQDDTPGNNTGTAATTVNAQADLSITKTDAPDPVNAGENLTYTLDFTNNGPSDAQSVSIIDTTPADTTFVSATAPAGWTSTTPPVGGTGTITFTKATSAPGETGQFTIVVNVDSDTADGSTITNTADATSTTTDPNPANNTATATTDVQTSADVAITKSDSPDPVSAGTNLTYTLDFSNNGPSDAQDVTITDDVPANTTFVSATAPAGWTTTTPPVGGTGTITFEKTPVLSGEAAQFTIVVAIASNIPDATVITNTATVTTATTDPDTANNSDTETTTVGVASDLTITKVDSVDPATAGQDLTYTITFANNGPSDAQNVQIDDPLPANTTFISATQTSGLPWTITTPPVGGTGTVTFTRATVLPGETATFDLTVNVDASTPDNTILSNTVTVASASTDPNPSDNSDTEDTLVREPSDLSITKTDGVTDISPGQSITYTIVASNAGPRDDPSAVVADDLPDEILNVSWSCVGSGGGTCAPSGNGDINETVNLPAGGSVTFMVQGVVDFGAIDMLENTATVTPGPGIVDPDPTNNTATDTDTILCLFCDEFNDSTVGANWTYKKSINLWSEDGNNLIGSNTRKASALASPVFGGCSICTVFTTMQTAGGAFNRVWLQAWYIDKDNNVELLMKQESGTWVLKQRVGGTVVAKQKVKLPIAPNTAYNVRITFDGTNFQVFIDGAMSITLPAVQAPSGTVGFKVKATTGTFDFIRVF